MAPHEHHEPFKAFAPIDWNDVPRNGHLSSFLSISFSSALTILESIPDAATPTPSTSASSAPSSSSSSSSDSQSSNATPKSSAAGRPRSQTDPPRPSSAADVPNPHPRQTAESLAHAAALRKEWKEVKVNPKENPFGIAVYKLAAKDGKGTWFARRSVHDGDGPGFDMWKTALEHEFAETMKVQSAPGSGSIRGIGADRRLELGVDREGKYEVFQLSAQFPGPTTPRDFVTLLLTSEKDSGHMAGKKPLRYFMVISKPCNHPTCAPRDGFIRGQYESVEIVREIPINEPPVRRSQSSVDLSAHNKSATSNNLGRNAVLRAAHNTTGTPDANQRGAAPSAGGPSPQNNAEVLTAIEWLMVTRSDPGGSVPRFMIEKGTPGGIISDAGKFVSWMNGKAMNDFASPGDMDQDEAREKKESVETESGASSAKGKIPSSTPTLDMVPEEQEEQQGVEGEQNPSSNGLYGIISQAIGAASSVATRLPNPFNSTREPSAVGSGTTAPTIAEVDGDVSTTSSASSLRSFASAVDAQPDTAITSTKPASTSRRDAAADAEADADAESISTPPPAPVVNSHAAKELRKLEAHRSKFQARIARMQARMTSRQASDRHKEEAAIARAHEKHERDLAKQEQKYHREMRKLGKRRANEERRAEERRRKILEGEEKEQLKLEFERVTEERDNARREIEALKVQVGELQAQNTRLVARLGRIDKGDLDRVEPWDLGSGVKGAVGRAAGRGRSVSIMSAVHS